MKSIKVALGDRSYTINVGANLLAKAGVKIKQIGLKNQVIIVTNPNVASLYGDYLKTVLENSGFLVHVIEIGDGEKYKSLETASEIYESLSNKHATRDTLVIALGGGVIGDLVGFVAATYQRGVHLVHVPTTLLAQVDSSIGGKVAVNYGNLKNQIGTFYQPRLVLSDILTLKSLPQEEFVGGLAEVIKSAIIADGAFFEYIENNVDSILNREMKALEAIIYRAAVIKVRVVEKDEYDTGYRHVLNLGHTFGHAIETVSKYKIHHGAAISIGITMATKLAVTTGFLRETDHLRVKNLLRKIGLPTQFNNISVNRFFNAIKYDKKIHSGRLHFILPRSIGDVIVADNIDPVLIKGIIKNG
jgi:3-dehydroquinate synthase